MKFKFKPWIPVLAAGLFAASYIHLADRNDESTLENFGSVPVRFSDVPTMNVEEYGDVYGSAQEKIKQYVDSLDQKSFPQYTSFIKDFERFSEGLKPGPEPFRTYFSSILRDELGKRSSTPEDIRKSMGAIIERLADDGYNVQLIETDVYSPMQK